MVVGIHTMQNSFNSPLESENIKGKALFPTVGELLSTNGEVIVALQYRKAKLGMWTVRYWKLVEIDGSILSLRKCQMMEMMLSKRLMNPYNGRRLHFE